MVTEIEPTESSETASQEAPPPLRDTRDAPQLARPQARWFYLGCALLAVGTVAFFVAFFTGIDESRKFLLLYILPLNSAIAAGCFAGSMQLTKGRVLGIAATGGFAIYVFTFLTLRPLETNAGMWLPNDVYDTYVDYQTKRGNYPAYQLGRLRQGQEEYLGQFTSAPHCWWSHQGLYKSEFDAAAKRLEALGFTLQSTHSFRGVGGHPRYQGTWVKGSGDCPP